MSDIVEALRAFGKHDCDCEHPGKRCPESLGWKAADEIEGLRAKLAKVREWAEQNEDIDYSCGTVGITPRDAALDVLAILDGDNE